jgi:hypothetical protein
MGIMACQRLKVCTATCDELRSRLEEATSKPTLRSWNHHHLLRVQYHRQDTSTKTASTLVKPDLQWYSCGVWQDFLYPCQQACAVFRKWKEKDFAYVVGNLVHPYYSFEFVQNTFKNNVFPVCLETIEYDGVTKEPALPKQQAGRTKTNEFADEVNLLNWIWKNCLYHVQSAREGATTNEVAQVSNSL